MEGSKALCPRHGEIFFLWMSVLSVFVGCILTSTADKHLPDDACFLTGAVIGFLGTFFAFGFVIYVSLSSNYHYRGTFPTKPQRTFYGGDEKQQEMKVDRTEHELSTLDEQLKSKSKEINDLLDMATKMLEEI